MRLIDADKIDFSEADHKDLIAGISDDILEWLQQPTED